MQTVDEQPRIDALRGVLSSVRFLSPLGHAPWHEVLALVQTSETGMPVLDLGERCRVEVNEFAHVEVQRHPGGVIGVEWRLNGAGIAVIVAGCFLGGLPAIIAVLAFARTTKPVVQRLQVLLSGQMQDPGHHAQHVHVLETPPQSTPHTHDTTDMIEAARRHESARNFEAAAKAFEEAGLLSESARVRRTYLESNPSIEIGRIGDTILHDSVMIASEDDGESEQAI